MVPEKNSVFSYFAEGYFFALLFQIPVIEIRIWINYIH